MHENHLTQPFFADYPAFNSKALFLAQNGRVRASMVTVPHVGYAIPLPDEIAETANKFLMDCQLLVKKKWQEVISLRRYLPIISNCILQLLSCENKIKTCFLRI